MNTPVFSAPERVKGVERERERERDPGNGKED